MFSDSHIVAVLEFGSLPMLGWLAAAALPWLIHLLSRRRREVVMWAAIDLLTAAVQQRSRRMRLQQLLLLLLRTAILAFAALAAAEPIWRDDAGAATSDASTHNIVFIDRSFSMAVREQQSSRMERAKQVARRIVEEMQAGDAVSVFAWDASAENVMGRPTFDRTDALAAIDAIDVGDNQADLEAAVSTALAVVTESGEQLGAARRQQVVIISDLAQNTWSSLVNAADATLPSSLRSEWARLAGQAEIIIESVDEGVTENLAIVDVVAQPPLASVQGPMEFVASVRNFGTKPKQGITVELLVDGAPIGEAQIDVQGDQTAAATFSFQLADPGRHAFEVRLSGELDPLDVDNRRWLVVDVPLATRVACFADDLRDTNETARALNPDPTAPGGIIVDRLTISRLDSTALDQYTAVWLCNVGELSRLEANFLKQYVTAGGALIIQLGDRVNPENYNRLLGVAGDAVEDAAEENDGALAPVTIAAQPVEGDWRLDPLEYAHPVLELFRGRQRAGLLGVRATKYFPVVVSDERWGVTTAMAFESGDPALLIANSGLGRVAILTTNPALRREGAAPWTSLAMSPSFLPLVRELLAYGVASRRSEALNRLVGESLTTAVPATGDRTRWKAPSGDILPAHVLDGPSGRQAVLDAPNECGMYQLVLSSSDGSKSKQQRPTSIAVNVDPRESNLVALEGPVLARDAPRETAFDLRTGAASDRVGSTSLTLSFLTAAVALLFIELAVAAMMSRGWT